MKALAIWVGTAVLLLSLAFQAQAAATKLEINSETTLQDLTDHYGNLITSVTNDPEDTKTRQTVTIDHADGTQTIVYLYNGKAVGMRNTSGIILVFDGVAMSNEFSSVYAEYASTRVSTVAGGDTSGFGGDNTGSTSSP